MKTLDIFIVELKNQINETVTTESGFMLHKPRGFSEFENRVTEGPVVCTPEKFDTGVKVGDTLYFHHLVVMNEGQVLTGDDDHYVVRYDDVHTINNQAIAYKCKDTGEVRPLAGWTLMEYVEDMAPGEQSDLIEVVKMEEKPVRKAKVSFNAPWVEELGVGVGDVVGIPKNMDYNIKIDGKTYFRVRSEDLLYVEEEVYND